MKSILCLAVFATHMTGCYANPPPYVPTVPIPVATDAPIPVEQWIYREGEVVARDASDKGRAVTALEVHIAEVGFRIANQILLSRCFQEGVERAQMTHTNDQTATQIYATMTRAPAKVLRITFYDGTAAHGTIGFDDRREPDNVHMNRHFVNTAYMVADNLLHEAAHARGFVHKSSREHTSVPYMMNHLFEACAPSYNGGPEVVMRLSESADETP